MTELESRGDAFRHDVEEVREAIDIDTELRRKLNQHGAELVTEHMHRVEEATGVVLAIREAFDVRDPAAQLDREAKVRRNLVSPPLEQRLLRKSVERVVDLDGRQPRRVIGEHVGRGESRRVEAALPLLVRESARAAVKVHALVPRGDDRSPRGTAYIRLPARFEA